MSRLIKSNKRVLQFLAKSTPIQRKAILQKADKGLVNGICECVHNILRGNVQLNKRQKSKLRKHKNVLRTLVNNKSLNSKKRILIQKGGTLLPLILTPLLTGAFQALFS